MKKLIILFACFIALLNNSVAQENAHIEITQHIIHLKNGSSIIGVLEAYAQDQPAVMILGDGERISIPYDLIESLEPVRRKHKISKIKKSKTAPYVFKEKGWHYLGNLGFISKGDQSNNNSIGLSLDAGVIYQFHRLLGIGTTIGFDSYNQDGLHDYMPVQLVLNGYLSSKNTSVFYSMGIGYGFNVAKIEDTEWVQFKNNGGLYAYPKIGLRLNGKEGINMTIFSGIKIQHLETEQRWGQEFEEFIKQKRTFQRLIIGVGFIF